jgi:hypothetical protein
VLPGTVKAAISAGIFGGEDIVARWQIQNLSECREKKGGEDELTQKRGRSSRKGPDASHSQVVDKGGWDRENSAESLVGEADRGEQEIEISNLLEVSYLSVGRTLSG